MREEVEWEIQLTGSSCSPEQMEGQVQTQEGKAEKSPDFFEGSFHHQQDTDAGSQVAIRQNPSVLEENVSYFCVPWQTHGGIQGLPWQHPFLLIGHMGPTHILEATDNSSHAGSCLGALSASGVMGGSFFGGQGDWGLDPLSPKQNAFLIVTDAGGHLFLPQEWFATRTKCGLPAVIQLPQNRLPCLSSRRTE